MQTLHAAAKMALQYWSVNPFHQIRGKAQHGIILWKSIDSLWKSRYLWLEFESYWLMIFATIDSMLEI